MMTRARTDKSEKHQSENKPKRSSAKGQKHERNQQGREPDHPDSSSMKHSLVDLQRTQGNHAVQRLVNERIRPNIQPNLKMGRPDDKYECEADQVAEQVMQTPESRLQRQADVDDRGQSRRGVSPVRYGATAGERSTDAPPLVHEVVRSPGQPLPPQTRTAMESALDHDFSGVRVHTDTNAGESARLVNALAYTVGQDIAFRPGAYRPETTTGQRLLVHELVHVQQQDSVTSSPVVQRYEGPEHQDLGDRYLNELLTYLQTEDGAQWARELGMDPDELVTQITSDPMQSGTKIRLGPRQDPETGAVDHVELTPGEIISLMGDLYGSVEQLANAPPREIRGILNVMQQERAGRAPDAAERFERITGGRYLELAQQNDAHFARLNRAEWRRLHVEALAEARAAGRENDEERFQRALLIDAAAGHFLTDAFAAGHLFDKSEVLAAITSHLSTHTPRTQNPEMQAYIGAIAMAGRLPQLVLKNIHDRMNQEGFAVENARGMQWRTFGDNYLEVARETQRVASLAVFLSRQQVFAAREGAEPNPDEVEALMPNEDSVQQATRQAIAYVPDAVTAVEGLIYQNRSLAPSQFGPILGAIVESNLTTIGHPGRQREILEMSESVRRIGTEGPIVIPSFTLAEWD